jgi:acetyl esterase
LPLDEREAAFPGLTPAGREAARQLSDTLFAEFGAPGDPAVTKTELAIPGPAGPRRAHLYRPSGADGVPLPAVLELHGGGWCIGSIDELIDDSLCRWRASEAGCVVVDLDYRLAPEHRFPAGLEDAYAALVHLATHAAELGIDPARIAVNGSSAGGNLSAALCLLSRDRGGPAIVGQVLEVPATDLADESAWTQVSPDNSNGIGTTAGIVETYLQGHDPSDPYASPLHAGDLTGLPPAHIITAEVDPLYPQGLAYAARLRQAGVAVTATWHWGELHGSAGVIGRFRGARLWQAEVVAALRDLFQER